jgi:nitroreductase
MEVLNKHVTIRKFKEQPVESETINSILYSGTRASTTGNMQLYSVIVTESAEKRNQLAPLHFNQNAAITAPVLLTFVADFNRFSKWCEYSETKPGYSNFLSFFTAATDVLLVAQNVCIAAENYGLGICYLGTTTYNAREIIEILNLPRLTFPVTTIALGYPDEAPELSDRIPLQGVIHNEIYKDYTKKQIQEIYAFKENLESSKQYVKENYKKTLSQVFTDVRYKEKDNIFFSEKMLDTLKLQGFMG